MEVQKKYDWIKSPTSNHEPKKNIYDYYSLSIIFEFFCPPLFLSAQPAAPVGG
jgi:hypothetical protein